MKTKLMPILGATAALTLALPLAANACGNKENLTQAQRTQLEQIKENTRSQVEAILTPQQQTQFQAGLQNGQKMRSALNEVNLTAEQQSQLQEVMQLAKQQKRAIFNQS